MPYTRLPPYPDKSAKRITAKKNQIDLPKGRTEKRCIPAEQALHIQEKLRVQNRTAQQKAQDNPAESRFVAAETAARRLVYRPSYSFTLSRSTPSTVNATIRGQAACIFGTLKIGIHCPCSKYTPITCGTAKKDKRKKDAEYNADDRLRFGNTLLLFRHRRQVRNILFS